MTGEFTEKCKTYENIAKANGLEVTLELKNTICDYLAMENQIEVKEIQDKENEDNKYKYLKSQRELQIYFDENNYGTFYFNFFESIISQIEFKNLTRVLYLCSYMNYKNMLVIKENKFNHIPMKNTDVMKVLMLSEKEYYRTKKELIDNNILIEKDGIFYINELVCKRGVIVENKKDSKVRTFDNAIKELYENSKSKEHKFLALIYKILPYINYHHNIVCKNPYEENKDLIEPFTVKELSEMFGYKNQTVFKNNLLKLKVKDEPVVALVFVSNKSTILINPRVYYKGNDRNAVASIENIIDTTIR